MDRAEDRLAIVGKLAEEADEVPRALTVETRRRLIEEEQRRATSELDTDGETLASLHAEREHKGIREVLKLEHLDHVLDVLVLLLLRNGRGLTEVGGEAHCLADRSRALVDIHLFSVGRVASEVEIERLAVEEQRAGDHTNILPLSKDIQTGRLA